MPELDLKKFRVNRVFTRMINNRRKALVFPQRDIPSKVLFGLLINSAPNVLSVQVSTKFSLVKKADFDKYPFRPKRL